MRKKDNALTEEQRLFLEKEREIKNIEDRKSHINEPTYEFNIGDKVRLGHLKEAVVDYISKDKKIYGLNCIYTDENYGNPIDYKTYRACAWNEIRPLERGNSDLTQNEDIKITFSPTTVESLINKYYYFGIDMEPDYQRGNVWSKEDKVELIDSIFKHIEIGKFALNHLDDDRWRETSNSYEIVDGKQRLNALIEFYENRFPYKGYYYNDLSAKDIMTFKNTLVSLGEIREADKTTVLKYFLTLNTTGHVMDERHIEKVEDMLKEELEKEDMER